MTMKLDQDYSVNGHVFKAGDKVDTSVTEADPKTGKTSKVDYADAIKEMQTASGKANEFANAHHGAVPVADDPQEAQAGTPTRPLATPNLAADEVATSGVEQDNVHEVKDPDGTSANSTK